jgi:hypothetical protein
LSRAIKAKRLTAPGREPKQTAISPRTLVQNPVSQESSATFLEWARATYELSRGEDELAQLGQTALDLVRDPQASPAVRLQAMAQFRACLRDLRLPVEMQDGKTESWPRRVG